MLARAFTTFLFALAASTVVSAELTHEHAPAHHAHLEARASADQIGPTPLGPTQDPFYRPPSGWRNKKLGAILRTRRIKNWGNNVADAYQILYRTQSHNGTALHTVTTVWIPVNAFKDRFVLASRPDNSVSYNCAPSWRFTNGTVDDQRYFDQRWIVTSVDHEGPDAAFGVGRLQGRLVLDAARALQNFAPVGLQSNPKIVIYGYSGGAGAAGWAATLKKSYAPELNVVGATFGGIPADLAAIPPYVDGTLYAGLGFLGAFGLARGYDAVTARLKEVLTDLGNKDWVIASQRCLSEAFQVYAGQKLLSFDTSTLGSFLLNDPIIKRVIFDAQLASNDTEIPAFPMYLYNGVIDQIIPIASVDAAVNRYCARGANLVYRRTALADHFADLSNGDIVPFITARFANTPFTAGCRRTSAIFTWQTTGVFNPSFFGGFGRQRVSDTKEVEVDAETKVPKIQQDGLFDARTKKLIAEAQKHNAEKAKVTLHLSKSERKHALQQQFKKIYNGY